jgi:hypothetical protein
MLSAFQRTQNPEVAAESRQAGKVADRPEEVEKKEVEREELSRADITALALAWRMLAFCSFVPRRKMRRRCD